MRVFWAQGYEGASLTDLTEAMGITRTSMYAAFDNKEELFRLALQRYTEGPASYALRATAQPTAQQVAAAFLKGSVDARPRTGLPARVPRGSGVTRRRHHRGRGARFSDRVAPGRHRHSPRPI